MYSQIASLDLVVNQITTVVVNTTGARAAMTAGDVIPSERIIYTGLGGSSVSTTPQLAATIVPTSRSFNYGNRAVFTDMPILRTIGVQATNQFANNKTFGGYDNSLTLKSISTTTNNTVTPVFNNNLIQDFGNISANVVSFNYQSYTTPGTYTWTVPAGVTSISVLGVGAGGGGAQNTTGGSGGSGGALTFVNNIPVTPGEQYTIVIGAGGAPGSISGVTGGDTSITKVGSSTPILTAAGGIGGDVLYWSDNVVTASTFDKSNTPVIYTFRALNQKSSTVTYAVTSGSLPSGITLNSSTGVLGGDPADVVSSTNYNFTVSASITNQTISKNFTLSVVPTPPTTLTISPAISGKTQWNLQLDGNLAITTAATTYTVTPTYADFNANLKLWGAGGGSASSNGVGGGNGGAGGYSAGAFTFRFGVSYQIIVGGGGTGTTLSRVAGGGGAGTGMQFTANTTPIIVAGGGGGGGGSGNGGTAGGGSSGQAQITSGDAPTGFPGTQAAAGAGGVGGRRTGAAGSGRNGGAGNTGTIATSGGTGFGNGGGGANNQSDAGSGGGGGGFFGGGEGGGNLGGAGGGGGSGYTHPTLITNAVNLAGTNDVPPNSSDASRGTAGNGGVASGNGANGIFQISV